MTRRKSRGLKGLFRRGPKGVSCGSIKWRCSSKGKACYATVGKGKSIWSKALLRAECYPGGTCQAEVLVGPHIIGRKRGLSSMTAAKDWACNRAAKG